MDFFVSHSVGENSRLSMCCPWLWILEVISSPQAGTSPLPGVKVAFPLRASLRSKHLNILFTGFLAQFPLL